MRPRFLVTAATALIVASLLSPAPVRAASNLLFILDSSGSMGGKLEGKAKMETAKEALSKLVGNLPADTGVGLMVYGHRVGRKEPGACADIELLKRVGRATPDDIMGWLEGINPKGKTPIAGSLKQAPVAFAGLEKFNNNIVLISDGIETCDGDPCAVAGELAKSNINVRVHVVGFDISEQDRAQLQCIAKLGKGKYFAANSTEGFTKAVTEAVNVAQIETKPEPQPQQPKPVLYFEDNFDGEDLGEHWEVAKPNPDAFIVEDGVLMVVSGTAGSLASETVENVFRLSKPLPKGDWTITAKFSAEFQAGRERTFIGIVENGDNYLEIAVQAVIVPWGNNAKAAFDLVGLKRSKGKTKVTTRRLWFSGRNIDPNNFVGETKAFPQPILLRLQKQGKSYIGSAMLEGAKEPKWMVLDKYSILRRLKGSVSLGFHQSVKTTKESTGRIDWIKIETLK